MDELEFVISVEFMASNESVMVLVAPKIADFSEKLATNESVRSKLDISMLLCHNTNAFDVRPEACLFLRSLLLLSAAVAVAFSPVLYCSRLQ